MNGFKSFSFLMAFIVATFLSTGIQSCSSEDDTDDVNISDNNTSSDFGVNDTINKAVTGGISKVGMTYANVFGYTNKFDMMTLIDIKENGFIGVEYGDSEDALTNRARCNTIEGRTLNIKISNLLPNKKYYYRTVIELNGVREVGEKVGHFNTNLLSYNGTISTGESETTYSDVIIEPGTVDESTLKDETHYIGIAVSLEKNKLTNGLSTRYKCAPFYDKWSTEATYDDVQFFRSFDSSSFTSTRIYNLDSGTTVYYTTILCIGDSVLTDVKTLYILYKIRKK